MGRPHRQRTQPMVERDLEFDHELEDEAFAGLPPALELRESVKQVESCRSLWHFKGPLFSNEAFLLTMSMLCS